MPVAVGWREREIVAEVELLGILVLDCCCSFRVNCKQLDTLEFFCNLFEEGVCWVF